MEQSVREFWACSWIHHGAIIPCLLFNIAVTTAVAVPVSTIHKEFSSVCLCRRCLTSGSAAAATLRRLSTVDDMLTVRIYPVGTCLGQDPNGKVCWYHTSTRYRCAACVLIYFVLIFDSIFFEVRAGKLRPSCSLVVKVPGSTLDDHGPPCSIG